MPQTAPKATSRETSVLLNGPDGQALYANADADGHLLATPWRARKLIYSAVFTATAAGAHTLYGPLNVEKYRAILLRVSCTSMTGAGSISLELQDKGNSGADVAALTFGGQALTAANSGAFIIVGPYLAEKASGSIRTYTGLISSLVVAASVGASPTAHSISWAVYGL